MVMINMNNPNTLIALAYIKTNDNPIIVFCNYILYLLTISPTQSLRADELGNNLKDKFGLDMPQSMLSSCIKILKREKKVKVLPDGGGYAIDQCQFDSKSFDETMFKLSEHEKKLLQSIVEFIDKKYQIKWTVEEAKKNLSYFLDEEGNGARLFLSDDQKNDEKKVSPSWYIGRYISSIYNQTDCIEKIFLEEIINGMMIYYGVYQTNNYQQDKNQKFKDTIFFLDTKLILRAMGFSQKEQVMVANELISLIKNDCDGKIGIFPQTLSEVKNALMDAYDNIKNNYEIDDFELKLWVELNPTKTSLLDVYSLSIEQILKEKFNVQIFEGVNWNDPINQYNVIDDQQIVKYIQKKYTNWRKGAISNDVDIIQQINIMRKGNYTVSYGGKDKLPIFVTSNKNLVYSFRDYVKNESEKKESSIWNIHFLPIISDDMLISRLWVPRAKKYTNLPTLTLAKYAYTAQLPTSNYFVKLKEVADGYKNSSNIDILDIDEERKKVLEDILVEKTHGDSENLTEEIVAMSADEFAKMQNISLINENLDLKKSKDNQEKIIENQNIQINKLYAEKFNNKIGFGRILIWTAKGWWIISTLLLAIIPIIVEEYSNINIIPFWISVPLPTIATILLSLLDKLTDIKDLQNFLVKKAVVYEWKKYVQNIKTKLLQETDADIEWIINYCLEHTSLFNKYKRFCTYR